MSVISPCINNNSEVVFRDGILSIYETFIKCRDNIPSPKLIPSIYNGTIDTLQVSTCAFTLICVAYCSYWLFYQYEVQTALQLNNIGDIDPAAASVEVDFYLSLYWKDERLDMKPLWEVVDDNLKSDGVHIDRIFYDSAGIFIWLPDIFFQDGLKVVVVI